MRGTEIGEPNLVWATPVKEVENERIAAGHSDLHREQLVRIGDFADPIGVAREHTNGSSALDESASDQAPRPARSADEQNWSGRHMHSPYAEPRLNWLQGRFFG